MIDVQVQLHETSQPIEHVALSTYTKGPMYCVLEPDAKVYKYPVSTIFRVTETYGPKRVST